jgi:hypothetical protein
MVDEDILRVFEGRGTGALFVTELAHALRTSETDLNVDLDRLSERGAVLISEHAIPDPHLEGIDLRIVAPVADDKPRAEAEARASNAAESLWNKWLAGFLSSHRCQ